MVARGLMAQLFAGGRVLIDMLPSSAFLLEPPIFLFIAFRVPIAGKLVVVSHIYGHDTEAHKHTCNRV